MLKFTPFVLMLAYGLVMYHFSVWRSAKDLDAKSTPLIDPVLSPLTARLAAAIGVPHIQVHLYNIEPVNGLAAPDGRIFLTRGFYTKFQSGEVTGEEIASVIAHELGHVALGHSKRRMIDFSGQNAIRMALGTVLNRFLPGFGAAIAHGVASMVAARLSRQDEYEADAYASAVLAKAGIGTAPQITLFRKLSGLTGGAGAGTPAWLLSHPKTEDRIRAIKALGLE